MSVSLIFDFEKMLNYNTQIHILGLSFCSYILFAVHGYAIYIWVAKPTKKSPQFSMPTLL